MPRAVRAILGDRPEALWRNELGGLTFRGGERVVKWNPAGSDVSLENERLRCEWLAPWHPVPTVLDTGADADGEWLVTAHLPGESAVSGRWLAAPATAVRAIGEGLRALHDSVPVDDCPWDWSVESRLAGRPSIGMPQPTVDRLVVCHGDACAPNTLLDNGGVFLATVDVGALGVADRWADLAVASMSLGWNYGSGWEALFYDAYGIERDPFLEAYYRRLWNTED